MTDITALDRLIEVVEAGKMFQPESDRWKEFFPVNAVVYSPNIIGAFNGSLDAAKALHDALLPGWDWSAHTSWATYVRCTVSKNGEGSFYGEDGTAHKIGTPARAWLIAILKAYRGMM